MYKNLKFSWAHILLFLAIIIIGYVTYVGITYKLDKGLTEPLWYTLGIVALLVFWFFGVQQLKGVDNNYRFSRCIILERVLLFSSPLVFFLCMGPFNHAWNVASHGEEIEGRFREAINSSTNMFDEYNNYSSRRIADYHNFLQRVKDSKYIQPSVYQRIGFDGKNDEHKIKIEVATLKRQLTENYDSLQKEATSWIKRADQNTSVWNVFLVGNIKEIKNAITDWNNQLHNFSSVILSTETNDGNHNVLPFDYDSNEINIVLKNLDSLSNIYTADDELSFTAILLGVILYLMMILPYFVQKRNGVSSYTLFGRRWVGNDINLSRNSSIKKPEISPIDMGDGNYKHERNENYDDILLELDNSDDEDDDRETRRRIRRERRNKREQIHERHRYHKDDDNEDDTIITPIENI